MIPASFLRKNLEQVKHSVEKRGDDVDFDRYKLLEQKRKDLQVKTEHVQSQSNALSKEVPIYKREGKDTTALFETLSNLSAEKKTLESELRALKADLDAFLLSIPNLLSSDVPFGEDEADNVIVEAVGEPTSFSHPIKSHTELFPSSIDFATAAKISGSRFVVLKSEIARLNRALGQWMLDVQIEQGYEEVNPPLLVERKALYGTGQLPKFESDQFFTENQSHALIPTAEVPLTNLCQDSIVEYEQLPLKYTALTHCFRSEAGAYGKDTTGMIRLHQFEKVELVQLVSEEQAHQAFEELVSDAERILKLLKLPYRKVLLCSKDTGFSSHITYDLEVWLPSESRYREISSCSYFRDFQAQRMLARYRNQENEIKPLHTINGSGLAVGRTLIAVIENYQLESGKIHIPEVLLPYMKGIKEINCD